MTYPIDLPTIVSADAQPHLVITGAAGLVGQNLVMLLRERGYSRITAIDSHRANLAILQRFNPDITIIEADMSQAGSWQDAFADAQCLFQLQAQIGAKHSDTFVRNTLDSTRHALEACRQHHVPYIVHISSSVVNSVADDDYVRSKSGQEQLVASSGIPHCILRPTLMFGWFDRKHLGWLSRFMGKSPVFPIPGDGRYLRQPLYVRDLCRALVTCMEKQPANAVYDLVGPDGMDYIDLIRRIRVLCGHHCLVLTIPTRFFAILLKAYAMFSKNPPFTADQLDALTAGDVFTGVDMQQVFGFTPTPLDTALAETFTTRPWSQVVLER
ncbi:MAG: NAD-dependent epimerase/dehydratase family protein [Gammaproteobacteria bacterium]|nr:MAG: NAD-dependent epimerase/dehydratase family protein [Gammaproteobacteria bacterium]